MTDSRTEWARANRATGPRAYHHFSKWLEATILENCNNHESAQEIHQKATAILLQAIEFSPIARTRGNPHSVARKLAGVLATRKKLSETAEAGDIETVIHAVARLWYHVLTTAPLVPRVDAIALGQYALDDLEFVLKWVANGEPNE